MGEYAAATEYKHQYDPARTAKLPAPPPPRVTTDPTSTFIGLPPCSVPPPAKAPAWASALYMHKSVAGHYTPTSTLIGGSKHHAAYGHAMNYKSNPAATVRYLSTPYLQPGDAGNGIDSRPTSSMAAFSKGGLNAEAFLNTAVQTYSKRLGTASSWTAERGATGPVLMPGEMYRTTTKDSYPIRSQADLQQQRMRDKVTSKHVSDFSLSSSTLRCPTAPLANGTPLHSTRFLAVRSSVRRAPRAPRPAPRRTRRAGPLTTPRAAALARPQDGGRRIIDTDHGFDEPPPAKPAVPPPAADGWRHRPVPYVPSHPATTYKYFFS
jgi:hypothetical protein